MWDDSGFGGIDSIFDSDHDGHLNSLERDHAESFLHDCDTFDQVLIKEGFSSSYSRNNTNFTSSHPNNTTSKGSIPNQPMKVDKSLIIIIAALIVIVFGALGTNKYFTEWRYMPYDNTLSELSDTIKHNNCQMYVVSNDWIYSLSPSKVDFNSERFTYNNYAGTEVIQENEILYKGVYSYNNFEKKTDKKKAFLMCGVLSSLISETEKIYYASDYYEQFGSVLEAGGTVPYKNDVTIVGYETDYNLILSTTEYYFSLSLDPDGKGIFVSKNIDRGSYYRYDLLYKDGHLESFSLDYWSTPSDSGFSEESVPEQKPNSHSQHSGKYDHYNSNSYPDAQSFADDYYEEFYDYGDYEDDEDAEDAAIDYWHEHND